MSTSFSNESTSPAAVPAAPERVRAAGRLKFSDEREAAAAALAAPNRQTTRVFDVPVVVDEAKCITGCHICVESCPVDCLAIDAVKGKSHMKYDDCWYCLACEVDCPTNAITVKMPFLIR